jgi:hypothetical protein
MKVQVQAVVVRHKDTKELLDVQIIDDVYCETQVTYPAGLVTVEEIKEYAVKVWGPNAERNMAKKISAVVFGNDFHFQHEAKDLPSIGKVQVGIELKEIDWE